jgi:serine/threonine protein kinase/lipopolysaccharide biosynthesis regulator YciM
LEASVEDIPIEHTETLQAPREELTTGSTFAGRYQIIEELGKGGMGKVYKAQDTEIKEKVALKLIKPEISSDKKTIERFQNELKFARKIGHRNVCRMYDLNKEEGAYYITMEYVSGEDLKSFIRRSEKLSVGKAISIAKQVCDGLAEAHRLGVVHRDLKPSNIMIDKEGNARIMDFGIARSLKEKGITGAGVMIGTPEYMSPEQVEGKEIDQRTDIYALGVILYEMVTGRVPFEGDTALTVAVKHKTEEPEDPRKYNTQLSEALSRVILNCLKKNKEERYQSAGELKSQLTDIEEGIPTTERIIPERKPLTSREITVQLSPKKLFVPVLVFVGIVILGLVVWRLLPKKEAIPAAASDSPSLAIMYFENNTGDEELEHYRKALSDLLIADLSQSKYIRVLRGDNLYNILRRLDQLEAKSYSSDVIKEVASQGNVNHILQGNYTKAGENFRINVMLHDANTEELISSESAEGRGEESIFSMVDELTKKIKANFNLSQTELASDIDNDVGQITTSSPEAYKYYTEGRKYSHVGDYQKSTELIKKAIELDPEFAMAYRALSVNYSNLRFYAESAEYDKKAFELSDRISDRERYLIQGGFYRQSEKTYDKAIEAYTNLLELYPGDWPGNNNLGILYAAIGERDKAIERYKTAIQHKDQAIVVYTNLASSYRAKGLYDEAKRVLEDYINNISDHAVIRRSLVTTYLQQGKYDLALKELDKAFLLDPTNPVTIRFKGNIYFHMGDLKRAEEEYQKLLNEKEPGNIWGHNRLIYLYRLMGRYKESKEQLVKALDIAKKMGQDVWIRIISRQLAILDILTGPHAKALEELNETWNSAVKDEDFQEQRNILFAKALAYIEMKLLDEAQRTTEEHRQMCQESMNKNLIGANHHLQGLIECEKRDYSGAIQYFEKARRTLDVNSSIHLNLSDCMALAYYRSGDLQRARDEYEKIDTYYSGRISYGDIYAKSFYMLGKIYEELGNTAKAIENYEKFLDLWKDADPELPEPPDARKRLAALKSI